MGEIYASCQRLGGWPTRDVIATFETCFSHLSIVLSMYTITESRFNFASSPSSPDSDLARACAWRAAAPPLLLLHGPPAPRDAHIGGARARLLLRIGELTINY